MNFQDIKNLEANQKNHTIIKVINNFINLQSDIFFEKMKKWGSGSILDLQNQSSDDGLKKVKFSDDDQVPAFQSAYHVAT